MKYIYNIIYPMAEFNIDDLIRRDVVAKLHHLYIPRIFLVFEAIKEAL